MLEISPSGRIDAPSEAVWAFSIDVEGWWVPSSGPTGT
jgi:ligand-binding SRPBCC domain-containing protein